MQIAARNLIQFSGEDSPVATFWGLTFTANEPGVVVNMAKVGSPDPVTLEYSTDAENWNTFDADGGTTPITLANAGDKVYFMAGASGNTALSTDYNNYRHFTLSKSCSASGNIMSLMTRDEADWQSVQMANHCYSNMFNGCTSLTSAPELPATTLASFCYSYMFQDCTSLTSAPELPATTLAYYCYHYMFQGCTSLTSVEVAFTDWNASLYSTYNWLQGVASNGTFSCPSALGTTRRDASHVPSGWTVVNT